MKPLKDHPGLLELRPRQGNSASRLVYIRRDELYVVLAVSKDHASDLTATITSAQSRLRQYESGPPE